jgi:protein-tyrosine phosphatase
MDARSEQGEDADEPVADLVLGASRRHRSTVVHEVPGALPIAFALREFARLVATADTSALPFEPVARAHALVEMARDRRGMVPPVAAEDDLVPDPVGGPRSAHHAAAEMITEAITTIVKIVSAPAR